MSIALDYKGNKVGVIASFDEYGNLYFEIDRNNDLNIDPKCYQVNINKHNIPFFEKGEYKVIKKKLCFVETFTVLDKETSLKARLKKEKMLQKEKNLEELESESDEEYDDMYYKFFEEENEIVLDKQDEYSDEEIDEENEKKYGILNKKFTFSKYSNGQDLIKVNKREGGEIMALYDSYVYQNFMIYRSKSKDNSSIYILKIYLNENILSIRPVGYPEKRYKILIDEEEELSAILL